VHVDFAKKKHKLQISKHHLPNSSTLLRAKVVSPCWRALRLSKTALFEFDTSKTTSIIRVSSETTLDPKYLSAPKAIEFPTDPGRTAFAFFYPPTNEDFKAPHGELPHFSCAVTVANRCCQQHTQFGRRSILDEQRLCGRRRHYGGSTGFGATIGALAA